MARPLIEVNIEIEEDVTAKHVKDVAQVLEEGDSLNIRAGEYIICATVVSSGKQQIARLV